MDDDFRFGATAGSNRTTTTTTDRGQRGLEAGRIRSSLGGHRTVSGPADFANSYGIDLSAGNRPGRPLGQAKQNSQGGRGHRRAREAGLGPERQIAGGFSPGADHDER